MGDVGDTWNDYNTYRKAIKRAFGIPCPQCKIVRPKASPTIMMPGQKCKVDGYVDRRPGITEEQKRIVCLAANAPFFEKVKREQ